MTSSQQAPLARQLRHLYTVHAPLTLSALITAAATLFFIVGIFVDGRIITGDPAWLKPTKFGVSITLYTLTITWMLGFVTGRRRMVSILGWTVLTAFAIEWMAIITQVLRGTRSHFNVGTTFDAVLFGVMGNAIVILWIANLIIAGLLLFQRFERPAFAWALRLATLIALIGMSQGFLMTNPTAQQLAGWQGGEPVTIAGAHSVGVEDGGPGLPVTGWSTEGGDLRIGHFVGMHALQVLPFLGWLIVRRRRLGKGRQIALVGIASAGYLGLTALLTWQALRAQPLLSPDALTLSALGALAAAVAIATLAVLRPWSLPQLTTDLAH